MFGGTRWTLHLLLLLLLRTLLLTPDEFLERNTVKFLAEKYKPIRHLRPSRLVGRQSVECESGPSQFLELLFETLFVFRGYRPDQSGARRLDWRVDFWPVVSLHSEKVWWFRKPLEPVGKDLRRVPHFLDGEVVRVEVVSVSGVS